MQRYVVSFTAEHVTVADLGGMFRGPEVIKGHLYGRAPKTVYEREGKRGTRLRVLSGRDSTPIRRAANRLFAGAEGFTRQWSSAKPRPLPSTLRV